MAKECEGCASYSQHDEYCPFQFPLGNDSIKCPCINCIIKTTCEAPCERFNLYTDKLDKYKRREIKNGI